MFHLILIFLYIMLVLELALWNAKINKKKKEIDKEDPSGRTPTVPAARHGYLTKDEVSRYSRQLILPQVGVEGIREDIKADFHTFVHYSFFF